MVEPRPMGTDAHEPWSLTGTLTDRAISRLLAACHDTRYPPRNQAIVLLACEAGLTPQEIASIRRSDVETDDGLVGDHIRVRKRAGSRLTDRKIPLASTGRLKKAILRTLSSFPGKSHDPLIVSERCLDGEGEGSGGSVVTPMRPTSIGYIFWKLAHKAELPEISGGRDARKTFIVRVGRAIVGAGGSARDVQALAGHRSLETTQSMLDADTTAQNRVIGTLFDQKPAQD